MRQVGRDQFVELGDELVDALGRGVKSKELDGDKTIAIGIVRPKDGTKDASTNLMENSKWTE